MWGRASTNELGLGKGGGGEKLKNIVMWGRASTNVGGGGGGGLEKLKNSVGKS